MKGRHTFVTCRPLSTFGARLRRGRFGLKAHHARSFSLFTFYLLLLRRTQKSRPCAARVVVLPRVLQRPIGLLIRKTARLVGTDVIEPSVFRTFLRSLVGGHKNFSCLVERNGAGNETMRVSVLYECRLACEPCRCEKTATLFSPPRKTGGVPIVPLFRLPMYTNRPSWLI